MGLNPSTFLARLEGIVTGRGFKREIQGVDINALRDADGTILTANTEPSREALETNFVGVVVSNNATDLGTLTFKIPRDYDATLDELKIRFLAVSSGNADAPTIDAAIYRKREGEALSADLGPTKTDAVNSNTEGAAWVEIDADGLGFRPGDAVSCVFSTSAHATDSLYIYAIEVVYRSTLVFYNEDER
jgi:hypothetical protein